MNKIVSLICVVTFLFCAEKGISQGYQNPVIPGFSPDPSICRVGDDFYLVNSSFSYFPGVPIFHSVDLVNWEKIGHGLTRNSQLNLENAGVSEGIYAPTISYHEDTFYIVTTNVSDRGNFLIHTEDPRGEWSDPIWLKQKGIDPSLYFEDDKYFLMTNPDNQIYISEINPLTGEQLSESKPIWGGTGGRYPEGPHIYKKDGWYYLLISEGGTEYGHKITIARSRKIDGPYTPNPANPILSHTGMETQTSPIQGTGHGDLVEAKDGSWWMVFLAFRPQSGNHHLLGRETFLAPVRWDKNAWPVVNGNGTVDLEMEVNTLPLQPPNPPDPTVTFEEDKLGLEWNYLRNPKLENYILADGALKLKATNVSLDELKSPTFLGRRQEHMEFSTVTKVSLMNSEPGDEAGLTVFMDNRSHYDLFLEQEESNQTLVLRIRLGELDPTFKKATIPDKTNIYLKVQGTRDFYEFSYSLDGQNFEYLGKMDVKYLSSETAGGFTGIYLGMFAKSEKESSRAYGKFEEFKYVAEKADNLIGN